MATKARLQQTLTAMVADLRARRRAEIQADVDALRDQRVQQMQAEVDELREQFQSFIDAAEAPLAMTATVDIGETWVSPLYETRDHAGTLAAAGTVTYAVTLPDGTAGPTGAATVVATGQHQVTFTPSVAGLHRIRITATGGVLGTQTLAWSDVLLALAEPAAMLVSVDEAVAHMRAQGTLISAGDMEQLRWLCQVATDAVQRDLDRILVPTTITETHEIASQCQELRLRRGPVQSVTSVTVDGTVVDPGDCRLSRLTGLLRPRTAWPCGTWGEAVVAYRAGDAVPPIIAVKVALNGVQRMWQSSQQMPHPRLDDIGAEAAIFGAAGTLTPLEMAAYQALRQPGFA